MNRENFLILLFHVLLLGWLFEVLGTPRVPVLSFHRILKDADSYGYLNLSQNDFINILNGLRDAGCTPYSPDRPWNPFKCQILLSFDDSTEDHFNWVIPYLRDKNWPSLFFVMGTSLKDMQPVSGLDYHWFASHAYLDRSLLHEIYTDVSVLMKELDQTDEEMKRLGMKTLPWFALPRGEYSDQTIKILSSRFEKIFSVDPDYMNPNEPGLQGRFMLSRTNSYEKMRDWILKSMPQYRVDVLLPVFFLMLVDLVLLCRFARWCMNL